MAGQPADVDGQEPARGDAADGGPVAAGLVTVELITGEEGRAVAVGVAAGDLGVPTEHPGSAMRAAQTEPDTASTRRCDMATSFARDFSFQPCRGPVGSSGWESKVPEPCPMDPENVRRR